MKHRQADLKSEVLSWFEDGTTACTESDLENMTAFVDRLARHFAERGVAVTPLLVTNVAEVCTWRLTIRRILDEILGDGIVIPAGTRKASGSKRNDGQDETWRVHPKLDALVKWWDRLRQAMKEVDALCPEAPLAADGGLDSMLEPILKLTDGLSEDEIEFGLSKKRRKRQRKQLASATKGPHAGGKHPNAPNRIDRDPKDRAGAHIRE
jgi:hypothetical protein